GNVGIGTTSPSSLLDVNGTAWLRGTGTSGLFVNSSGNVGIGKTNPAQALDIVGNLQFSSALLPNGSSGTTGQFLISQGTSAPTWTSSVTANALKWNALTSPDGNLALAMSAYTSTFTYGAATGAGVNLFNLTDTANNTGTGYMLNLSTGNSSALNPFRVVAANGVEALMVKSNGNVGIGTTSPSYPLSVNGDIQMGAGAYLRNVSGHMYIAPADGILNLYDNSTNHLFQIYNVNTVGISLLASGTSYFNGGNVGIGTTAPLSKLGILGNASVGATYGSIAAPTSGMIIEGNVGIGTTSPGAKLEIGSGQILVPDATYSAPALSFSNDTDTGLYRISANDVGLSVGGAANMLRVTVTQIQTYANGSATAPAFADNGDTTTGLFYPTTGSVAFSNSGTEALRITNGNVGIGTTGPSGLLSLGTSLGHKLLLYDTGTIGTSTGFGIQSNLMEFIGGDSSLNWTFGYGTSGSLTRLVTIKGNGNVGIGTTAPLSKLGILGNASVGATYGSIAAPTSGMIIEGNVGIGTTAPGANLDVSGSTGGIIQLNRNDVSVTVDESLGQLQWYSNDVSTNAAGVWASIDTISNGNLGSLSTIGTDLVFRTGNLNTKNTEYMRITSTGNVGIGTTGPGARLQLQGAGDTTGYVFYTSRASAGGSHFVIQDNSYTGIGTTAPAQLLEVSGTRGSPATSGTTQNGIFRISPSDGGINVIDTGINGASPYAAWIQVTNKNDLSGSYPLSLQPNAGNVGIGTTGPTETLQIQNTNSGVIKLTKTVADTVSAIGVLKFGNANIDDNLVQIQAMQDGATDAGMLGFWTEVAGGAMAERMTIKSTGNVGIGTTGPHTALEVRSATAAELLLNRVGSWAGSAAGLKLSTNDAVTDYWTFGMQPDSTNNVRLRYNSAEYLTVLTNGNVGIGTTAPTQKLDIVGNLQFSSALLPNGSSGTTGQFLISQGTSAPIWTSSVTASSIAFSGITSGTNTQASMVVGTGAALTYSGTGTINASSLVGATWVAPGTIGSTTPNTGAFTTLSASGLFTQSGAGNNGFLGNVGIGVTGTGVTNLLTVSQAASTTAATVGTYGIDLQDQGSHRLTIGGDANYAYIQTWNSKPLQINNQGNNVLFNSGGGSVGIGTTNPLQTLSVNGNLGILNGNYLQLYASGNGSLATMAFNGTGVTLNYPFSLLGTGSNLVVQGTGNTTIAGNVGIGTTGPASLLDVAGTAWLRGVAGGTSGLFVNSSGNVGVGTTGPDAKLDSLATTEQLRLSYTDGSVYSSFTVNSSGDLTIDNTGTQTIIADDLAVNGATSADITTTTTTATVFNTTATTLSLGGAATTALNLGNGSGNYTAINLGSGAGTHVINIAGTGATAADTINIGTGGTGADTINLGSNASTTALNYTSGTGAQTFTSSVVSGTNASSAFVFADNALTTGIGMYLTSTSLTSGKLFDVSSILTGTAFTGKLANIDWSPSGSTNILNTGDLLRINTGQYAQGVNLLNITDNGSSIFSVNQTAITAGLPTSFTSAGDVSLAYDLIFTNQTASNLKSNGPLYITAGESWESNDLTLQTYNSGNIILNSANLWADGSNVGIGTTSPTYQLQTTGTLGIGSTAYFASTVGIGTTAPGQMLQIGTAGTTTGAIRMTGSTSGYVEISSRAIGGSWTMNLPQGVGTAGYQLTDAAGNGNTSWAAAGSVRSVKNITGLFGDPNNALATLLDTNVYRFHYKPEMGTGDSVTEYVGIMADESPWAVHYNGTVINPVNTLGYMVLGVQALNEKISALTEPISLTATGDLHINQNAQGDYAVVNTNGQTITDRISTFASSFIASLTAGIVNADKLISPIAEIDTLRVNTLSVADGLLSPLAEIDEIVATNATISGTLYAADIQSPQISNLKSQITNLDDKYASASAILASIKAKYADYASLNSPAANSDPLNTTGLSSTNATISGEMTLYNQPVIITDALMVNTSLISNSINSNDTALYIQPTANQPINLLAGLMILTPDGKVVINGDLTVSGTLSAENINAKTLSGVEGQITNLQSQIATVSGSLVANQATISDLIIASGAIASASASPSATSSASLASNATIGTGIIASGSAEVKIENSKIVDSTYIYLTPISDTANQVLYIKNKTTCPNNTSEANDAQQMPTNNCLPSFTVSITDPVARDIKFNYWLIQSKP
ncbi:hypothetical protein HYU91_02585, partial [Candidatus Collierbacteria bacterium]|nr:hypothetical protein [Candidatus Collierbacteria bacterium]